MSEQFGVKCFYILVSFTNLVNETSGIQKKLFEYQLMTYLWITKLKLFSGSYWNWIMLHEFYVIDDWLDMHFCFVLTGSSNCATNSSDVSSGIAGRRRHVDGCAGKY